MVTIEISEQEEARLREILGELENSKQSKEGKTRHWNENHFAMALFALSTLAIFAGLVVEQQIFRSYMEQLGDIGLYHIVIAGFFALFGTTRVNIVEKILDSDMGVAVFMCGYVVGLALVIAG